MYEILFFCLFVKWVREAFRVNLGYCAEEKRKLTEVALTVVSRDQANIPRHKYLKNSSQREDR
jgi:hypothetical protein